MTQIDLLYIVVSVEQGIRIAQRTEVSNATNSRGTSLNQRNTVSPKLTNWLSSPKTSTMPPITSFVRALFMDGVMSVITK
jgi:hypothetical protein